MIRIASHISELEFSPKGIAIAEADGKKICVGKFRDQYFGFAYKCPHASGLLAYGHIDANGNVVCPLHRYKYDISNGRNVSGEGYYLKHWSIIQNEEGVFVDMEAPKGLFGWF